MSDGPQQNKDQSEGMILWEQDMSPWSEGIGQASVSPFMSDFGGSPVALPTISPSGSEIFTQSLAQDIHRGVEEITDLANLSIPLPSHNPLLPARQLHEPGNEVLRGRDFDMRQQWSESEAAVPSLMPNIQRPMHSPFETHPLQTSGQAMRGGLENLDLSGVTGRPFSWPQLAPPVLRNLASIPSSATGASAISEDPFHSAGIVWRNQAMENLGSKVNELPEKRRSLGAADIKDVSQGPPISQRQGLAKNKRGRSLGDFGSYPLETSFPEVQTRPDSPSLERGRGISIGNWKPQQTESFRKSRTSQLSERERRKRLLPSLEVEDPSTSAATDLSLEQLAGSLDSFAPPQRRALKYRIRSNALERQRSTSEPPAPGKSRRLDTRQTPLIEPPSSSGLGMTQRDSTSTVLQQGQNRPQGVGPNQMVVDAVKLATFLDQLHTIQAKMQSIQMERDAARLRFATVQKAATLLSETVSEMSQQEGSQASSETQNNLKERSEEIQALLSTVTDTPDQHIMKGLEDALAARSADLKSSRSGSDTRKTRQGSMRESAGEVQNPSQKRSSDITLALRPGETPECSVEEDMGKKNQESGIDEQDSPRKEDKKKG